MAERRQLDRLVGNLDTDQSAAERQAKVLEPGEMIGRYRARRVRGIGMPTLAAIVLGAHGEDEGGAEGMGGAEQGSHVDGLADAFHADAEITFHAWRICSMNQGS